jgi:hypothetical protein
LTTTLLASTYQYQAWFDITMVRMTIITRLTGGLVLCASMESENETAEMAQYKKKAKDIINSISDGTPKCINDPPYYFLYVINRSLSAPMLPLLCHVWQ